MRNFLVVLLVAPLIWILTTSADALVICGPKSKEGSLREGAPIRLRSACRSNEVEVETDSLGLKGRGVIVRDATGKTVGPVVDANQGSGPTILIQVGPRAFYTGVSRTGLNGDSALRFETADCSGAPVLDVPSQDSLFWEAVRGHAPGYANKVYLPNLSSQRLAQIEATLDLGSGVCTAGSSEGPIPVFDVGEVREFTPPFSVEVER